jgi:hypothetical protein
MNTKHGENNWPNLLQYEQQILVAGRLSPSEKRIGNGWRSPTLERQVTFMPIDADAALAEAGVSRDDVNRWHDLEWASDDLTSKSAFDRPELAELAFIRDIARSGLSDAQITQHLSSLKKPYCYDSGLVAYSFLYGWVQLPIFYEVKEVKSFIDAFVEEWIKDIAQSDPSRLDDLVVCINEALEHGTACQDDSEEEGRA